MKNERTVNIILLVVCACLYLFIRWFRTAYQHSNFVFLKYHFSDLLAPIVVLSYGSFLLNIRKRHSIKKLKYITGLCLLCSFVWEYCAQFLYPKSTSDWLDVCAIFGGGFIYWIIINLLSKEV